MATKNHKRPFKAIDSEKLKAAVTSRYKTYREVGEAIGMGDSAVSNWIQRKEIPEYAIILLENGCGIPPEEYVVPDKPERSVPDKMNLNGRACHYCSCDNDVLLIDSAIGEKMELMVDFQPKRKVMELVAKYGKENILDECDSPNDTYTMINFCPYCGREL